MSDPSLHLREYQARAVDRTLELLDRRPLLVAPTGSGKTVMGTAVVRRFGGPALWLAHRKELVEQAAERLVAAGLDVGLILAGKPRRDAAVQVASVQTLARRTLPPARLVVIDEAHHATAESYGKILRGYEGAAVAGLTATPFRLDGTGLGDVFGELVIAATTYELCREGVLHKPRVFSSEAPDLRGLSVVAGDYATGQLAARVGKAELVADIVRTWKLRAEGMKTVVFAVNTEHSRAICDAFAGAGVPAGHIDGRTPREQREATLELLRAGELKVVCNCMVLTEGWDLPALECAVIARPTASLNLHLQMIGRVMRACPGKDGALVLDHAGNHHAHGEVDRPLAFTLEGGATRPAATAASEALGLRRCTRCGRMYDTAIGRCPECGMCPAPHFPRTRPDEELVEFSDGGFGYRRSIWQMLEEQRQINGYRPGWSAFRFQERFGVPPVLGADGDLVDPRFATPEQKRSVYERLASTAESRGYQSGWASHRFHELFGHWPRGFVTEVRAEQIVRRWGEKTAASEPALAGGGAGGEP